MKTLAGLSAVLFVSTGLFAQNRTGFVNSQGIVRSFPSVIYPGGTSALPGVQRTAPSVLFPAGGTQIAVPGLRYNFGNVYNNSGWGGGNNSGWYGGRGGALVNSYAVPVAVPVPVYVGNGYDDSSAAAAAAAASASAPPPGPQAPANVIIIYPQGAVPPYGPTAPPQALMPQAQPAESAAPPADNNAGASPHYFIALKDHSIFSAVAYWVDGDTLHYFTSGNTHNEVSLALVDRDLTRRLNEGSGLQLNLPPAK